MINLTTPVGRIVQGELWKSREVKDVKGVVKLNADNTPQISYFFAQAIPKEPGHTHWAQTEWGRKIWDEGNRAHPTFAPHPTFSWKIEDGDSVIPNKKGKKNCDREGHPGHWILKFSSSFAINRTYNANGTEALPPEAFKPGYYVQVCASVKGNTGDTPGVYLNPVMVALAGYGAEIESGPDVAEAGFGQAPLPAGASAVPVSAFAPPSVPGGAAAPTLPTFPALPGVAVAAPYSLPPTNSAAAPAGPATTFPSSPLPVLPNPGILAAPAGIPVAPPPPPAAGPRMTAKAGGATFDAFVAQGWTLDAMRAAGYVE